MNYFSVNGLIGCGPYASPDFATPEEFIAHLDYLEIDRALVAGVDARDFSPNIGNRELLKTIAPFQERLRPVFYLTPADYFEYGTLAWLKEQAAAGNRVYRVCPA